MADLLLVGEREAERRVTDAEGVRLSLCVIERCSVNVGVAEGYDREPVSEAVAPADCEFTETERRFENDLEPERVGPLRLNETLRDMDCVSDLGSCVSVHDVLFLLVTVVDGVDDAVLDDEELLDRDAERVCVPRDGDLEAEIPEDIDQLSVCVDSYDNDLDGEGAELEIENEF